ncbi:uncharacterized protein LOC117333487 [Pecten maximus]|uniref:uncharacterized protein LOC117333487 n=1 Tax=Pecten maximus TaxID=6579 RepID=UPI0014589889|nr:uncharacterized protein LOC117333487 [Pecten maximus]
MNMDTDAETSDIKAALGFRGSKEEKIVQQFFKHLNVIRFINCEIHKCNAEDGSPFSEAYITLKTTHAAMVRLRSGFVTELPSCEAVDIEDILDTNILKEFQKDGVDIFENDHHSDVCQSFLVLLNFLRDKKSHERGIGKLIASDPSTTSKETQIMTGLAHHLFSQLVPNKTYEIDENIKNLPKTCCCGCNSNICGGDTSIGTRGTWHGRVDIMVNDTVAVAIGKEPTDNGEEEDEDDDENDNEPQSKRKKVEMDQECENCVEFESSSKCEIDLFSGNTFQQLLAKTITNGFAQVNRNRSTLSNFLIPTFGVTSDHVSICLYDPENDCLLHIDKELKLWTWGDFEQLEPVTIIIIWLFLNFTVLTKKNLASEANLQKSGLHEDLKGHLQYYKETKAKAKFVLQTSDSSPWDLSYIQMKHRKNN